MCGSGTQHRSMRWPGRRAAEIKARCKPRLFNSRGLHLIYVKEMWGLNHDLLDHNQTLYQLSYTHHIEFHSTVLSLDNAFQYIEILFCLIRL